MHDPMNIIQQLEQRKLLHQQKVDEIKAASHELDDVINFRVSKRLKAEFNRICKDSQSTISRELKRYMLEAIEKERI